MVSGVGYGMGDVTLENFLVTHGLVPDFGTDRVRVLVTRFDDVPYEAYLKLVEDLHRAGVPATVYLGARKYGKQLEIRRQGRIYAHADHGRGRVCKGHCPPQEPGNA